jgi:hypothetical protein
MFPIIGMIVKIKVNNKEKRKRINQNSLRSMQATEENSPEFKFQKILMRERKSY